MSVTDLPGFLTLSQASVVLGSVSARTLRREIGDGNLRASYVGKSLRIAREDLEEWRLSRPSTPQQRVAS